MIQGRAISNMWFSTSYYARLELSSKRGKSAYLAISNEKMKGKLIEKDGRLACIEPRIYQYQGSYWIKEVNVHL